MKICYNYYSAYQKLVNDATLLGQSFKSHITHKTFGDLAAKTMLIASWSFGGYVAATGKNAQDYLDAILIAGAATSLTCFSWALLNAVQGNKIKASNLLRLAGAVAGLTIGLPRFRIKTNFNDDDGFNSSSLSSDLLKKPPEVWNSDKLLQSSEFKELLTNEICERSIGKSSNMELEPSALHGIEGIESILEKIREVLKKERLFDADLDVLEAAVQTGLIDLEKIIDPIVAQNLLIHEAGCRPPSRLNKLVQLFPNNFLQVGQEVIKELLKPSPLEFKHIPNFARTFSNKFEQMGGKLDTHYSLWLQIAEGVKPDKVFKEKFALLNLEKRNILYNAAFEYNNPFLYESPDCPVKPEEYAINLMWVNKNKLSSEQHSIFEDSNSLQAFIESVAGWIKLNPETSINIWIDGNMTNPGAVESTRAALRSALDDTSFRNISFRDIHSMETVQQNPNVFDKKIPIYFRVDLLKAIIADHILSNKETKYSVFVDLDMQALSGHELFDKKTVNFLDDYGFVMAKGGHLGFENGFQILNGENRQLMESHRKVIIDLSIEMALEMSWNIDEQQIYDTYPALFIHFLQADGRYGKIIDTEGCFRTNTEGCLRTFGQDLQSFRYDKYGNVKHYPFLYFEDAPRSFSFTENLPAKPVPLPPSHFGKG